MKNKSFDPQCLVLAKYFFTDFREVTEKEESELAREIQQCIEDHLSNVEFEGRYK